MANFPRVLLMKTPQQQLVDTLLQKMKQEVFGLDCQLSLIVTHRHFPERESIVSEISLDDIEKALKRAQVRKALKEGHILTDHNTGH